MPGQELQNPKGCDPIPRVLGEAKHTQDVLDVRGFEKPQATELHERDVAPGELDFEFGAVVRGPEQDRLSFQRNASLARLEHPLDHVADLAHSIPHRDQRRLLGRGRSEVRSFVNRSAAKAITAFEASRMAWVER